MQPHESLPGAHPPGTLRFSGAVLAGGRSSRMGRDKALIDVGGRRLVEVAIDALWSAGATDVVVVGGDGAAITALGHRWTADRYPGDGPLGGIITALDQDIDDPVVVLACDHIAADARAVRAMVAHLGAADVAFAVVDERLQTLHGVWRRQAVDHLRRSFEAGERAVRGALADLTVVTVDGLDRSWFADADTPDALVPQADPSPTSPARTSSTLHNREALPITSAGSQEASVTVPEIDVVRLAALGADLQLIDVREPDEYAEAHIAGARLIPLQQVPAAIDDLDRSRPVHLICRSGGRSMRAATFLADQGLDVVNVAGGMLAWIDAGQPVDVGSETT